MGRSRPSASCAASPAACWSLSPDDWLALFERAGFLVFEHEVYALGADGWHAAPAFEPSGVRFAGEHASAVLCAELHPATLGKRAREALRRLRP